MDIWDIFTVGYFSYGENGRRGLNYIFVGAPGEAKTALVRTFMRAVGHPLEAFEGSRMEPQDIAGLHVLDEGNRSFSFAPPAPLRRLADAGDGLLFLDEWTRAPAAVQGASLNLVLDGRTEGIDLPPGIARWAACNPAAMVGGIEMDPANAARFIWIQWPTLSASDFRDYLLGADSRTGWGRVPPSFDPVRAAKDLDEKWDKCIAVARTTVGTFLARNPSCLRESAPAEARAWANPRTWTRATEALAACDVHGKGWDVKMALLTGAVGSGPGNTFVTWLRTLDLPDPEAILSGEDRDYDIRSDAKLDRVWTVLDATLNVLHTAFYRMPEASAEERRRVGAWAGRWVELLRGVSQRRDARDIGAACAARAAGNPLLHRQNDFMRALTSLSDYLPVIANFTGKTLSSGA